MTKRGCPKPWSQSKNEDKPEIHLNDPQQEEHPDATKGRDIAGYNLHVDYEGSEPKVEPVAHEQRKVNPDAKYAKMKMPRSETFRQRMLPLDVCIGILKGYKSSLTRMLMTSAMQ